MRLEKGMSGSLVWSARRWMRVTASNTFAGSFAPEEFVVRTFMRTLEHLAELGIKDGLKKFTMLTCIIMHYIHFTELLIEREKFTSHLAGPMTSPGSATGPH